jgi:serine phosphatase RsbU (regulator of sigma subunit)
MFLVNSKGVTQVDPAREENKVRHLELKKGDSIYMFTDGYVDQMGGGEGKKMLNRKVSEILFRNWPVPMKAQKEGLLLEFESWRGNYEQVDDVLVMGIRF